MATTKKTKKAPPEEGVEIVCLVSFVPNAEHFIGGRRMSGVHALTGKINEAMQMTYGLDRLGKTEGLTLEHCTIRVTEAYAAFLTGNAPLGDAPPPRTPAALYVADARAYLERLKQTA